MAVGGRDWCVYHKQLTGVRGVPEDVGPLSTYLTRLMLHGCQQPVSPANCIAGPRCLRACSIAIHDALRVTWSSMVQDTEFQWRMGDVTLTQVVPSAKWSSIPNPDIQVQSR